MPSFLQFGQARVVVTELSHPGDEQISAMILNEMRKVITEEAGSMLSCCYDTIVEKVLLL
ncbi:MAG: hypothetical protein ACI8RD_007437 [Bacillariaceae sp.]|jgi:hypothetical protein